MAFKRSPALHHPHLPLRAQTPIGSTIYTSVFFVGQEISEGPVGLHSIEPYSLWPGATAEAELV